MHDNCTWEFLKHEELEQKHGEGIGTEPSGLYIKWVGNLASFWRAWTRAFKTPSWNLYAPTINLALADLVCTRGSEKREREREEREAEGERGEGGGEGGRERAISPATRATSDLCSCRMYGLIFGKQVCVHLP